jgi:hypothetical protein
MSVAVAVPVFLAGGLVSHLPALALALALALAALVPLTGAGA